METPMTEQFDAFATDLLIEVILEPIEDVLDYIEEHALQDLLDA